MPRVVLVLVVALVLGPLPARADEAPLPGAETFVEGARRSISLREAIELALSLHPRDREIEAELRLADAHVREARSESLPRVDLRYQHIWEDSHIKPNGVRDPLDLDSLLLIARVPIVDPRAWANWSEAREHRELAHAQAVTDRRMLALVAGRAWIDAASATHALDVELEALRTAREHVAFVQGRLASGATSQLERVRAEREVAVASAHVERSSAALERARERLGLQTGFDQGLDATIEADDPLPSALFATDIEVPEVATARFDLEVRERDVRNMVTSYLPRLELELIGFYQTHPQPILPVTGVGYAAFLTVVLPIYDGRREAQLHERRAERDRAEARLEDSRRIVEVQRRDGQADVRLLRASLAETERAAELSHEALRLSEVRFENGAGTQLDVIYALREARDASIAVTVAEDAYRRAALDLLAARGRFPELDSISTHHGHH